MLTRRQLIVGTGCAGLLSLNRLAQADSYPDHQIRIVCALPAGTATDLTARAIGTSMSKTMGQTFFVDNRPGAGGSIGASYSARAQPDGYTIFMAAMANLSNQLTNPTLNIDLTRDFAPIALLTTTPNVLTVSPSLGVKTVAELVKLARAKPGQLSFGSSGLGSTTHLSIVLLNSLENIDIAHVPYLGSPQALTDLLAGRIQGLFAPASSVLQYIASGKLVALATTEKDRLDLLQDVPTMVESGLPTFRAGLWAGLVAPKNTPAPIIQKLSQAANASLKDTEVGKSLAPLGLQLLGSTPDEFGAYLKSETERWGGIMAQAGAKP